MSHLIGTAVARAGSFKILIVIVKTSEEQYQGKVGIVEANATESEIDDKLDSIILDEVETIPLGIARGWIDAVGDWVEERPGDEFLL